MRIGIMLRHYRQHRGGVRIYTENVVPRLLSLKSSHQFVLLYQDPGLIGTFAGFPNVEEIAVPIPGTVLWDQIAVPWMARRKRLDVIFNPKFTVPVLARAKKVFVLHGSEWFVIPEHFLWYDRWYFKRSAPFYCRRADAFITVSEAVKRDAVTFTGVEPGKIVPVHNGFDAEAFQVIGDSARRDRVRQKYRLPERMILWIGQLYPPKNLARLLQAFALIKDEFPHQLVLVGVPAWQSKRDLKLIDELGIKDRVYLPGWVSHDDLPVFYNLADLFVLPSLHEGFGIPLLEAMACGCPVVTANTCSPPEVTGGAAVLVDPMNVAEIAGVIRTVLSEPSRREEMSARGLSRVQSFGWDKCARQILELLESLNGAG